MTARFIEVTVAGVGVPVERRTFFLNADMVEAVWPTDDPGLVKVYMSDSASSAYTLAMTYELACQAFAALKVGS